MTKTLAGMVLLAAWGLAAGRDGDVAGRQAAIGQAMTQGTMKLDRSPVAGGATLYAGSELEAGGAPVRFMLNNGVRGSLGPSGTAALFGDRMLVKSGDAAVSSDAGFRLEAGSFSVAPGRDGRVRVQVRKETVLVASLSGAAEVFDAKGVLLARVAPEQPLAFEPGTEPDQAITVTGVLESKDGRFQLKDEVTGLVYEVTGEALRSSSGRRVQVNGKLQAAAQGQPQVIVAERTTAAGTAKASGAIKRSTRIRVALTMAGVGAAAATLATISR